MTILRKAQVYDPERHGNPFTWILMEAQRLRYWDGPVRTEALPLPTPRIVHRPNNVRSVFLVDGEKSSLDQAREHVVEGSKRRKL
jgi:hypothetical protein